MPLDRFGVVSRDPSTISVHHADIPLRLRTILLSSKPIPPQCFLIVLGNTLTDFKQDTEGALRLDIPLFSGKPIPLHGFIVVQRDALSVGVHRSEDKLGSSIA